MRTELIFGPPGCGKAFLALDLAMATLTGRDWGGRKTTTDPARSVLWLAGEGSAAPAVVLELMLSYARKKDNHSWS